MDVFDMLHLLEEEDKHCAIGRVFKDRLIPLDAYCEDTRTMCFEIEDIILSKRAMHIAQSPESRLETENGRIKSLPKDKMFSFNVFLCLGD